MTGRPSTEIDPAIGRLQARWAQMNDMRRATAVHQLHESGHSWRSLAEALGCSESLLRKLDRLTQASPAQQIVAAQDGISTRKLLRVLAEQDKRRAAQIQQARAQKQEQEAQAAARAIFHWLEEHNLAPAQGESVPDEVRRELAENERNGILAQLRPAPEGTPLDLIRARTRPEPSPPGVEPLEENSIPFYVEWLALWAFHAFPNPDVRDRALRIAADYLFRGVPTKPNPRRK